MFKKLSKSTLFYYTYINPIPKRNSSLIVSCKIGASIHKLIASSK